MAENGNGIKYDIIYYIDIIYVCTKCMYAYNI